MEVDGELAQRDQHVAELEESMKAKDGELQDLEDLIMHKDRLIEQLH